MGNLMNWWQMGALLGLVLAGLALSLLAAAPVGWRLGWWHYRFSFTWLMTSSGALAFAAAIISLACIVLGRSALGLSGGAMAVIALAMGIVLAGVPWHYDRLRKSVPRIHDITTDTESPPEFAAVLPARAAEQAATSVYGGAELANLQHAAYPDMAPLRVASTANKAYEQALAVAKSMPGWTIVAADPGAGRIEASATSRWFHFTDDVVIRVAPDGSGSRIDMRSLSRQGRSDFGVNAARIRTYLGELKRHVGAAG
jgi:uncharacterized protein (DUF1499 family)